MASCELFVPGGYMVMVLNERILNINGLRGISSGVYLPTVCCCLPPPSLPEVTEYPTVPQYFLGDN